MLAKTKIPVILRKVEKTWNPTLEEGLKLFATLSERNAAWYLVNRLLSVKYL